MKLSKLLFYLIIVLQIIRMFTDTFDFDTLTIIALCIGMLGSIRYYEIKN